MTRNHLFAAALFAALGLALTAPGIGGTMAYAAEQPADLQAQGMAALKTFWTAIVAGTPAALDPVLAPEYQVQRNDGSGYDKAAYLKSELPKVAAIPEFTSVKVTGSADLLVVRYFVTVDQTRGGKKVQRHAPRLTVFRKQGDAWLVVAHANFATLDK
jgi:ketosteroid isomerase-like protein